MRRPSAPSAALPPIVGIASVLAIGGVLVVVALFLRTGAVGTLRASVAIGRVDLALDASNVELVEGFGPTTALAAFNDYEGRNPDRDEVAVSMPREGRLRWHVGPGGGRFVTDVARLSVGAAADAAACEFSVSWHTADGAQGSAAVDVPAAPAYPGPGPGAGWREGPATALELPLPDADVTLDLLARSPEGVPDGGALALLAPRVERVPVEVPVVELPLVVEHARYLMPLVTPSETRVTFAERRLVSSDGVPVDPPPAATEVERPAVEPVGAFPGAFGARPAVAFTGGASWRARVDVHADDVLRGDVALDVRLPGGVAATIRVFVDGEPVGAQRVDSSTWSEFALPLREHAGTERELTLVVEPEPFEPAVVLHDEPDFVAGVNVRAAYTAHRARVGWAEPRLQRRERLVRRIASRERPTVLLVHVETLRADVLAPYGGRADVTPNLARLAERSVVFERAMAPSPWTLPSTASLLTGVLPGAHGVTDYHRPLIPGDIPTLAEHASAAGVTTAAFVTNDLLQPHAGYGRGFELYALLPYANARQVFGTLLPWWVPRAPLQSLVFAHLWDPHGPYNAPEPYRERFVDEDLRELDAAAAVATIHTRQLAGETVAEDDPWVRLLYQRYLGEVAWLDAQLGRLVDAVDASPARDATVLVITADHGEEFLEHGLYGHSYHPHEESVHVPLIVYAPGGQLGPPGRREGVVGTAGLHALVLELLDVEYAPGAVLPSVLSARGSGTAFSETRKGLALDGRGDALRRRIVAVRGPDHRLMRRYPVEGEEGGPTDELYDLAADPREQLRVPTEGPAYERLAGVLDAVEAWTSERSSAAPDAALDGELLERLRGIGYVGGDRDDG